jgi:hypothetical protein
MANIRIHHQSGELIVWQGEPADLLAARKRIQRSWKTLPPGKTPTDLVRSILLGAGLPDNPKLAAAYIEAVVVYALDRQLKQYAGETDLDIWVTAKGANIALRITQGK